MITPLIKLWVDDCRTAPGGWYWAKNVTQAINIFTSERVAVASLDHDLGARWDTDPIDGFLGYDVDAPTGSDLIDWIADNSMWPSISLAVHSANPYGARYMRKVIAKRSPYSRQRFFKRDLGQRDGMVDGMIYHYG